MTKTMISARVDVELNQKLEALAASTQRSKAFLIKEALEALVEKETWLEDRIARAVERADENENWVSHKAMGAWIDSLGSATPLSPPESDVYRAKQKSAT